MPWVVGQKLLTAGSNVEVAVEGRVGAVLVQAVADGLLVEAAGGLRHPGPGSPRRSTRRSPASRRPCTGGRASVARVENSSTISRDLGATARGSASLGSKIETESTPSASVAEAQQRARRREQAEHHRWLVAELLHRLDQADRLDTEPVVTMRSGSASRICGRDRAPVGGARRVRDVGHDLEPALLGDRARRVLASSASRAVMKSVEPLWLVTNAIVLGGSVAGSSGVEQLVRDELVGRRPDRPAGELAGVGHGRGQHRGVLRQHVAVALGDGHRRQDVRRGVGTHDQVDLVLADELLVEARRPGRVGLVVEDGPLDRSAEQPAVGVEPFDEHARRRSGG